MKYFLSIFTLSLILLTHTAVAQENDSLSRKSFSMAESAYANGQYKDAVSYIKYAEIYSGGSTPKSLYIKIRALDQLANQDQSYVPALQSALDRFFEVTDKSVYPQEKYQEIASIMNRHKSPSNGPVVIPASNNKYEAERLDYLKAIKANTKEAYKEFLDTYTYTPHYAEIKDKYDALVEQDKDYRHHKLH